MFGLGRRFLDVWDIAAALTLAMIASFAVGLPAGSLVRIALTAPILLFSPGYLLLQALLVPARPPMTRVLHAVLSVGISLAMAGLVALSTGVVRGAFKPAVIVGLTALTCIGLAALAGYRRLSYGQPASARESGFLARFRRPLITRRQDRAAAPPRPAPTEAAHPRPAELPIVTAVEAEPPTSSRSALSAASERSITTDAIIAQQESR